MATEKFELLRGKIRHQQYFENPKSGFSREGPRLPTRDPKIHQKMLESQLSLLVTKVSSRKTDERVPDAHREIIAVKPERDSDLPGESLGDKREDVRVVSQDPDTGLVLIDAPNAELKYLHTKLAAFMDDSKISEKSGLRKNEALLAPIANIELAKLVDRADRLLRKSKLDKSVAYWFELGCRGGLRRPAEETENSRLQMRQALKVLGYSGLPEEFLAAERVWFFVRLRVADLTALVSAVDCVFEVNLTPSEIRDFFIWKELGKPEAIKKLQQFKLTPPPGDAPAVVLLDTGIATKHPMLESAILTSTSAVPEDLSAEDAFGHGTEMGGLALYDSVGAAVDSNSATLQHWLQSCKVLTRPGQGTAAEENRHFWPRITENAVKKIEAAEDVSRHRIYTMAVTAELKDVGDTLWSSSIDQLAFNDGHGRLFLVSIGNAPSDDVSVIRAYPNGNLVHKLDDPAHAVNALTVGAYTTKTNLPPDHRYRSYSPVSPQHGLSPHSRSGYSKEPIKPDVVFEGGNIGFDGHVPDPSIPTLVELTTGHEITRHPIVLMWGTSAGTANAARWAARLWDLNASLRPETVRALMVHSASWTQEMMRQMPNLDDRLGLVGYGVPDIEFASRCAKDRATVVVESRMPNRVVDSDGKIKRIVRLFEMPVPRKELLAAGDNPAQLRVTLSYFPEPNTVRRTLYRGLDIEWDMQGPDESMKDFVKRINKSVRAEGEKSPGTASFPWDIGKQRRSRGTVQSDRWNGRAADLAGSKWIAVYPISGWWDDRKALEMESMRFSLIVTVEVAGLEIYNSIKTALEVQITT